VDRNDILWIGTDRGAAQLNLQSPLSCHQLPTATNMILVSQDGVIHGVADKNRRYWIDDGKVEMREYPEKFIIGMVLNTEGLHTIFTHGVETMSGMISNRAYKPLPSSQNVLELSGRICWPADEAVQIYSVREGRSRAVFNNRVETLAAYNDSTILLGTWEKGLVAAQLTNNKGVPELKELRNLTENLQVNDIRSLIVTRRGDIWVGTRYDGLLRLQCDNELKSCNTQMYNTSNGMVSNWITSLAEDVFGHIWAGCVSGLVELIPDTPQYMVFPFGKAYGISDHILQILTDVDSNVIYVGSSGYGKITPQKLSRFRSDSTFITDVFVNNRPQNNIRQGLTLNHQQNNLQFEFASPAYLNASDPPFVWRLLGSQDTSWSASLHSQALNFANLTPGHYSLEVAHVNWAGGHGPVAVYDFEIRPPYWRQTWFIILCIIAFLSVVYGLYKLRIRQIRRVQRIRDRIAADLHDEIGSSLTHVNILAEIGKQESNGEGRHAEILERIGQEAQSSAESLDDIIWSVKSRADVVEDVVARMRQYVTELFGSSDTTFELRVTTEGDSAMNLEQRRDLYLIYKELLRNVQRHATATHVTITVHIKNREILLEIEDDGKGFDTNASTTRNGLENIRQRAQRWKGTVVWSSVLDEGTRATVRMARV
jgi:signal transduction histidine kinase